MNNIDASGKYNIMCYKKQTIIIHKKYVTFVAREDTFMFQSVRNKIKKYLSDRAGSNIYLPDICLSNFW